MRPARLDPEQVHGPPDPLWRGPQRAGTRARSAQLKGAPRLGPASVEALRLLEMCPCAPIDVLTSLLGSGRRVSAYQLLARLRRAGLTEVRRVDLGYLVSERPFGLWWLTDAGRDAAATLGAVATTGWPGWPGQLTDHPPPRPGGGRHSRELPRLVAAYRLLAAYVQREAAAGRPVQVLACEAPWARQYQPGDRARPREVVLPGAALVGATDRRQAPRVLLLLPDLGTAPVVRARHLLRRLVELRAASDRAIPADPGATSGEPLLLIGTSDPPPPGARAAAWVHLSRRAAERQGERPLKVEVVVWSARAVREPHSAAPADVALSRASWAKQEPRHCGPIRRADQVLDLAGRHPFLSLEQLADVLDLTRSQAARLLRELAGRGWLRLVGPQEVSKRQLRLPRHERSRLRLVEVTAAGRRELARWLGLESAPAARHHALVGGERQRPGKRNRLRRVLAHTLGVNAVFVALALAARAATAQGGDDALEEWRSAAACERHRCKPDGYGRYRRGASTFGFLLEYDRSTERAWKYAAKFAAYYAYRDSGEAARDYAGFPTVLFVTTHAAAETRIARAALEAWYRRGGEPLPVLLTTTDRIEQDRYGILGPIWRTPAPVPPGEEPPRRYWLPGGPPRGLFGIGRHPPRTPRLVWPTVGQRYGALV